MEEDLKEWMDQFVRVRLIQCNSVDLNLFHFDYDLTFAAFFMNADKTIYGRYGTRSSHKEAEQDISIEGFSKAMQKVLELHRNFPSNKAILSGKTAPFSEFKIPQDYPQLEGRFQPWLDFGGKVAASCIHCHMVGEADRRYRRTQKTEIPDKVIYPWPMPNVLGISLDPGEIATIESVTHGSVAELAGFKRGDKIESLNKQPIVSIADVQWVMHEAPEPSTLHAVIIRSGDRLDLELPLEQGWRRSSDIGWRTTSWDLRRMAAGGLKLRSMSREEISAIDLPQNQMALLVEHVGQYGNHAIAKRAGFIKGDIMVSFDGKTESMRETEIFAHVLRHRPSGTSVEIKIIRKNKPMTLHFKLQ
jgi:serine protease Do